MKIFWVSLSIISGLILIFFIFMGVSFYIQSIDKTDTFYLNDSALLDRDYLTKLAVEYNKKSKFDRASNIYSVYAHRLMKDKGIVFSYRWYSNGNVMTIDDEGFEKLTIWVPDLLDSDTTEFQLTNKSEAIAIYTKGGSAWPKAACSGILSSGKLKITKDNRNFNVSLQAVLIPLGNLTSTSWCKKKKLQFNFTSSEIEFNELTAWLGKPGTHPYDETYR